MSMTKNPRIHILDFSKWEIGLNDQKVKVEWGEKVRREPWMLWREVYLQEQFCDATGIHTTIVTQRHNWNRPSTDGGRMGSCGDSVHCGNSPFPVRYFLLEEGIRLIHASW